MPNDPVEFVYLFESYKTKAFVSLGITLGSNFTNPRIIEPWFVGGNDTKNSSSNSTGIGFHLGLNLSRYITNRIFMNLGFNYMESKYSFTDEITNIYKDEVLGTSKTTYNENITRFDIPFTIAYELSSRSVNLYFCAGFSIGKINNVTGIASRTFSEDLPPVTSADLSMTDLRENLIYSNIFGSGLKIKVPRGYLVCDLRYYYGLNNIIKPETRNEITELWSTYYYLDDDYALNSYLITIGYYFSFYQPKKQK
jgi:hypothetical protein